MGMKRSLLAVAALALLSAPQPPSTPIDDFNLGRSRKKNPQPKPPKKLGPKIRNPVLPRR